MTFAVLSVNSIGGSQYFVTFIDDFSRYTYVYFIKHKGEVLTKFKEFVSVVKNRTGRNVKIFRTNNGVQVISQRRRDCTSTYRTLQSCTEWCVGKDESPFGRISTINGVTWKIANRILG